MPTASNVSKLEDVGSAAVSNSPALLTGADTISRPWPRSVLPNYSREGITVGLGNRAETVEPYNPFQRRTGFDGMTPALLVEPTERDAPAPVDDAGVADFPVPQS